MTGEVAAAGKLRQYNLFLLGVAGLGGLLYGVDVGIIGGALPYLEATSHLDASRLATIVAAVLLGSVISTIFAGMLADWVGRKPMMIFSGLVFVISIPLIALSHGYETLLVGRLLQGMSGGFIGVVIPLYLAESLVSNKRGKGAGIFQWLLTFGIVAAALIGMYYSYRVRSISATGNAAMLFQVQDAAWRHIFWLSLPPGILFCIGSFFVEESPRWLFRRGETEKAFASLTRSRGAQAAFIEIEAMRLVRQPETLAKSSGTLLQRKFIVPFLLACVILACNTATGINSIIGYNTNILLQSGLSDLAAHWGYVIFTAVNFLMTIVGMNLVDRLGRRFLLIVGTSGIMVSLVVTAFLFHSEEKHSLEVGSAVQSLVDHSDRLNLSFHAGQAAELLRAGGYEKSSEFSSHASLAIIYSYGGFTGASTYLRSDDSGSAPLEINREESLPANRIQAFFMNPFADLSAAKTAPLKIERARIGSIPNWAHGYAVAVALFVFVAFFAFGPGVCVWLALSELMPTRIRSNGMSIALVINQLVSTLLAVTFLPVVSKHGYTFMFLIFAASAALYLFIAAFLLPETKGKTLEEVERYFGGHSASASLSKPSRD